MVKLSHSLFALPFAGIGVIQALRFLQPGEPVFQKILLIIICMVSARSAAMGMNRFADRLYDKKNPRTSGREIPSGVLSEKSVIGFIFASSVIFVISSFYLNLLSFYLSFFALFILFFYSYSKRFTWLCHFILGISIGFAPLGAWIGLLGEFSLQPILWFSGLLFQISGFDILYATQDMDFDKKEKLFSIPARYGKNVSFKLAAISYLLALAAFAGSGMIAGYAYPYYLAISLTGIILYYNFILSIKSNGLLPPLFYQLNSYISLLVFFAVLVSEWSNLWK